MANTLGTSSPSKDTTSLSSDSEYNKEKVKKFLRIKKKENLKEYFKISFKLVFYLFLIFLSYLHNNNLLTNDSTYTYVIAFSFFCGLILYLKTKNRKHSVNSYQNKIEYLGVVLCGVLMGFGLLNISPDNLDLICLSFTMFSAGIALEFLFSVINTKSYYNKMCYGLLGCVSIFNMMINLSFVQSYYTILPWIHTDFFVTFSLFLTCFILLVLFLTNENDEYDPYPEAAMPLQILPSIMIFEIHESNLKIKINCKRLKQFVKGNVDNLNYYDKDANNTVCLLNNLKGNELVSSGDIDMLNNSRQSNEILKTASPGVNITPGTTVDD